MPGTEGPVECVVVDAGARFQEVLGIGTSLEASTAFNIARLDASRAAEVLRSLFDVDQGIGLNLARITIGTSDFAPLPFYSYDDLDDPSTSDPTLANFSVAADEASVLPLILGVVNASRSRGSAYADDGVLLFASPWSPPAWMKTSHRLEGGGLLPRFHRLYAQYLVSFAEAYARRGVRLHALTVQNEPLAEAGTYPTSLLQPAEEAAVIRLLGPMLEAAGLGTRIWCFDHNWGDLWYPMAVLRDDAAAAFVDGTGFHHYSGGPENMTRLHEAYPDKRILFTEGSTFGVRGAVEIVKIFRNWASTYTAWVTMLDTGLQPNAGPFTPSPTMLLLDNKTLAVRFGFDYHMYGHFSKFVRRGAMRIGSTSALGGEPRGRLPHVAFVNSERASGQGNAMSLVLVVVNPSRSSCSMRLRFGSFVTDLATLPGESVATFRWMPR